MGDAGTTGAVLTDKITVTIECNGRGARVHFEPSELDEPHVWCERITLAVRHLYDQVFPSYTERMMAWAKRVAAEVDEADSVRPTD